MKRLVALLRCFLLAALGHTGRASSSLICEDSIDGLPPFNQNTIPCFLGCDPPRAVATLSFLPGTVNTTDIPYCHARCVRPGLSDEKLALAPGCSSACQWQWKGTAENYGWCLYWCLGGQASIVESTTCVGSLQYGPPQTTIIGGQIETYSVFTKPAAAWESWYATQTVLSKTGSPGPGEDAGSIGKSSDAQSTEQPPTSSTSFSAPLRVTPSTGSPGVSPIQSSTTGAPLSLISSSSQPGSSAVRVSLDVNILCRCVFGALFFLGWN